VEEPLKHSVTASPFKRVAVSLALLIAIVGPHVNASTGQPSALAPSRALGISQDLAINQLHHTAFNAESGVPPFISSMAQDSHGFLWLASSSGLYRFDGLKFDDSLESKLPPGLIQTVYATSSGDLWLGYRLGGLARVHEGQITAYPFGKDIPSGTPFDFRQTPDGVVWVGCTNGLARFVNGAWRAVGAEYGYDGRRLLQMVTTQDGSLWAGGTDFAMVLRPGAHRFVDVPPAEAEEEILRSPDVEWWHYGSNSGQRMRDSGGAMWVGSPQGIRRYRAPSDGHGDQSEVADTYTAADGLTDNEVLAFFEDREGGVWVTTLTGIDQFRVNRVTPIIFDRSMVKPAVAFDADGVAWVGNIWSGYRIVPGLKPETAPLLGTYVSLIAEDPNGTIWFSNDSGLHKIVDGKSVLVPSPPHISGSEFANSYQAIAFGPNNVVWLSISGAGLYALKDGEWQKDGGLHGLPDDLALRISFDHRGRLWLLYSDGRVALVDHGSIRVYTKSDGLTIGVPTALSDTHDQIWLAGSEGLARFDEKQFIGLKMADSHLSEGLTGLVPLQNGDLWIHGDSGLIWLPGSEIKRAIGDSSYAVKARAFGAQDGVVGVTDKIRPLPSLVPGHDGRLWVTTNSAVAWIDPHGVPVNDTKPYPVIDTLEAGDKYYPGDRDASLPVGTRNVQIAFTAGALRIPSKVHFEYRLDGVDPDWQSSQESRQASYTNLGHGQYIFHVRAANEDGVAGDHEASMRFTIDPAFYEQTWFRILCVLLVITALWRLYVMRVRYLVGVFRAKVQERERIARELHDTLLQSVQGLLFLIESVSRAPADEDIRDRLRDAISAARQTIAEGRGSVTMLRVDDQEIDLVKLLGDYAKQLSDDFGIPFRCTVVGESSTLNQQGGHELMLALREALTNAFQHAKAGHIDLYLHYGFWRFKAEVVDDGSGIEALVLREGGKSGHWGLPGMRERVEALGGICRIVSAKDMGTRVQISVRAGRI
jgi:ligand-binding sensor domain-containing protein/two-component sensor histidine kinase